MLQNIYETVLASYDSRHSSQNRQKYVDRKLLLLLLLVCENIRSLPPVKFSTKCHERKLNEL